jgi:hypothetical protein
MCRNASQFVETKKHGLQREKHSIWCVLNKSLFLSASVPLVLLHQSLKKFRG